MAHENPAQYSLRESPEDLRESFSRARDEIVKRIELRDRMLVVFMSISIAILGGTIISKDPMIGLLIPVFGIGAALVVGQHTEAIHGNCCWTRRVIPFRHWGRSRELRELHSGAIMARAAAQMAMFVAPGMVAIAYGYDAAFARTSVLLSGLWWIGVLVLIATALLQLRTLLRVLRVNSETGYEDAFAKYEPTSQRLASGFWPPTGGALPSDDPALGYRHPGATPANEVESKKA